jgi:hypothetical protein
MNQLLLKTVDVRNRQSMTTVLRYTNQGCGSFDMFEAV